MDILIPNLELPKEGFVRLMLWHDGGVSVEVSPKNYEQLEDNAVELPPHGDLKDVNRILQWLNLKSDNRVAVSIGEIFDFIENQPTVLEAST